MSCHFSFRFEDKMQFGAYSEYPKKFRKLNKNIGFVRMCTLPGLHTFRKTKFQI